jgi:ubiquinone/menaquinone biosynthesis C-methylase UbiE
MLKTQTAREYWDRKHNAFSRFYFQPDWFDKIFRKALFDRIDVAVEVCKTLEKPTVLDVGSGPGINSVSLVKAGGASHLSGIDFAPNMVSLAREIAESAEISGKCNFMEGDFLNTEWRNQEFDLVVALGVLDYVSVPDEFLKKIADVTRRVAVISWPEKGFRMLLRKVRYKCHVYGYTQGEVTDYHNRVGFNNLVCHKCDGGWVTIGHKS